MTDGSREGEDTLDGYGVPAVPAVQPSVGAVVGRYVVVDRLGAGAMGVVYTAWDPELDRRVALKLLHDGARSTSQGRSRLVLEAQALARLAHPNVVAVHDVGTLDDRLWIAMEFVQGATLDRWLRSERRGWRERSTLTTTKPVVEMTRRLGQDEQLSSRRGPCSQSQTIRRPIGPRIEGQGGTEINTWVLSR